jgi:hypothetical protein
MRDISSPLSTTSVFFVAFGVGLDLAARVGFLAVILASSLAGWLATSMARKTNYYKDNCTFLSDSVAAIMATFLAGWLATSMAA